MLVNRERSALWLAAVSLEIGLITVLAVLLAPIIVFGFLSEVSTGQNILIVAGHVCVGLSLICTIDLLLILRRSRCFPNSTGASFRLWCSISGGVVALLFFVHSRLFETIEDRWATGQDFLDLACLLWIPISHLLISKFSGRRLVG